MPGSVGSAALAIDGKLVYLPPPGQGGEGAGGVLLWAVIGLAVAIPAVAGLYLLLARLTRPTMD